ncbi:hypothetical protein ALP83_03525 [Pseudomonas syringae pv. actinidiae]|uniref:Uncharacterized protein n=1 Tax=Pseudomonas syringae pv. actinidiae TaxID=103796 RepID=A0A7Z6UKQ0_PSESF|nr:hypothetical protein ALP83_03525 [Pseudomonas syringae pv. actinidiae]
MHRPYGGIVNEGWENALLTMLEREERWVSGKHHRANAPRWHALGDAPRHRSAAWLGIERK